MKRLADEENEKQSEKRHRLENFDELPEEILLKILKYLNVKELCRCAKVCTRFWKLSHDEYFWRKINLCWNKKIPAKFLEYILDRGCKFLSLRCARISGNLNFQNSVSQLNYLDFGFGAWITNDEPLLEELTSTCHSLEKLSLARQGTLNLSIVRNICQNGQTLQILDLSDCAGLNFEAIGCIVTACVELSELNLDIDFEHFNFGGDSSLCPDSVKFLCENLTPKIKKLSLLNQHCLNDENVKNLVIRCNKITELNVCSKTTSEKIVPYIVENLSDSLVKLGLDHASDAMLNDLRLMKNLKYLYLSVPPWSRSIQNYKALKTQHPWIEITHEAFRIASPYFDEEDEARFQFWDISAKQIDLFSVCSPAEEQADD